MTVETKVEAAKAFSREAQPEGYIVVLKGGRREKVQRYYLIAVSNEEINQFWLCWARHIRPPKPVKV